jgi:hypothetical protein
MRLGKSSIWQSIKYLIFPGIPASLCVILGARMLVQGFLDYQAADDFWSKAIATTGIIVKTESRSGTVYSGGAPMMSYSIDVSTIQFTTQQGEIITFKGDDDMCVDRLSSPCKGKEVEIVYNSSNPHQAIVEGSLSPINRARYSIGWSMFITLSGIMMFATPQRN